MAWWENSALNLVFKVWRYWMGYYCSRIRNKSVRYCLAVPHPAGAGYCDKLFVCGGRVLSAMGGKFRGSFFLFVRFLVFSRTVIFEAVYARPWPAVLLPWDLVCSFDLFV